MTTELCPYFPHILNVVLNLNILKTWIKKEKNYFLLVGISNFTVLWTSIQDLVFVSPNQINLVIVWKRCNDLPSFWLLIASPGVLEVKQTNYVMAGTIISEGEQVLYVAQNFFSALVQKYRRCSKKILFFLTTSYSSCTHITQFFLEACTGITEGLITFVCVVKTYLRRCTDLPAL